MHLWPLSGLACQLLPVQTADADSTQLHATWPAVCTSSAGGMSQPPCIRLCKLYTVWIMCDIYISAHFGTCM